MLDIAQASPAAINTGTTESKATLRVTLRASNATQSTAATHDEITNTRALRSRRARWLGRSAPSPDCRNNPRWRQNLRCSIDDMEGYVRRPATSTTRRPYKTAGRDAA